MTEREKMLRSAIQGMAEQYSVYYDESVMNALMRSPESVLLPALVEIVDQCLCPWNNGEGVDTLAESAGEWAVVALAEFGLMECVSNRFGRWTPAGKKFRAESMQEWRRLKNGIQSRAETKRQAREVRLASRAETEQHARQAGWTKYAFIMAFIAGGIFIAGWLVMLARS